MKKIKITAGIIWAIAGLVLIINLFPGLNNFSTGLSGLPFMKINPRFSGGEVASEKISVGCTLIVRKPVFNGLFRERNRGFVQVEWHGNLPEIIRDTIVYNSDKKTDFIISINTADAKSSLQSPDPGVRGVGSSTRTSYGWAARVNVRK
ncbi:MAG: hypothetical protein ABSG89_07880 [Bacteroidales bacterium]|jgi:hypothetical protein